MRFTFMVIAALMIATQYSLNGEIWEAVVMATIAALLLIPKPKPQ